MLKTEDIILRINESSVTNGTMVFIHIKNKEANGIMLSIVDMVVGFVLSYLF